MKTGGLQSRFEEILVGHIEVTCGDPTLPAVRYRTGERRRQCFLALARSAKEVHNPPKLSADS